MTEHLLTAAALIATIAATVRQWFWRKYKAKHADAPLFLTHTPHAFQPGKLHDGNVITRLVQVAPTALVNGGRAPCWEVYGRPNTEVDRASGSGRTQS
jgi:hypothetical protein